MKLVQIRFNKQILTWAIRQFHLFIFDLMKQNILVNVWRLWNGKGAVYFLIFVVSYGILVMMRLVAFNNPCGPLVWGVMSLHHSVCKSVLTCSSSWDWVAISSTFTVYHSLPAEIRDFAVLKVTDPGLWAFDIRHHLFPFRCWYRVKPGWYLWYWSNTDTFFTAIT